MLFIILIFKLADCGLPAEYCEYGNNFESCKPWLIKHAAHLYPQLVPAAAVASNNGGDALAEGVAQMKLSEGIADAKKDNKNNNDDSGSDDESSDDDKKKSKKAAAGSSNKGGAKKGGASGKVWVEVKDRGRKKHVTTITGLDFYVPKLKEAASTLGKKFGTGASVTKNASGVQEIDVQGDMLYDIVPLLTSLFNVPEDLVVAKE